MDNIYEAISGKFKILWLKKFKVQTFIFTGLKFKPVKIFVLGAYIIVHIYNHHNHY